MKGEMRYKKDSQYTSIHSTVKDENNFRGLKLI